MNSLLILNLLFLILFTFITTADNITFKNVNVTIVVIKPINKGNYEERVRVIKPLKNSNRLMDILKGRNLTYFNALRIENQMLPVIRKNAFEDLELRKLSIKNCDTEVIEKKAFQNVLRLEYFVMQNTSLDVIFRDVFENLPLKSMDLSNNEIRVIEYGALDGLNKLEELILSGNKLTRIVDKVFVNLNSLKSLYIDGNLIAHIDKDSLVNLTALNSLYLERNRLSINDKGMFGKLPKFSSTN